MRDKIYMAVDASTWRAVFTNALYWPRNLIQDLMVSAPRANGLAWADVSSLIQYDLSELK